MRKTAAILAVLVLVASGCGSPRHVAAPVVSTTTTPPTTAPPVTLPPLAEGSSYVATLAVASPLSYGRVPNGPVAGQIPPISWYNPTAVPVIGFQDGWVQVRMGTRPNGSTGWVPKESLVLARTPYKIVISISQRSLTLFQDGRQVFSEPVGVGAPSTPTPLGTTFVSSIVAVNKSQLGVYGPFALVLGTHSEVYSEFDGGDGTVAIHGYPSDPASTKGVARSHGCVRVSPAAIDAIKVVPAGTPVDVVA